MNGVFIVLVRITFTVCSFTMKLYHISFVCTGISPRPPQFISEGCITSAEAPAFDWLTRVSALMADEKGQSVAVSRVPMKSGVQGVSLDTEADAEREINK